MDRISEFACNIRTALGKLPDQLNLSIPVVLRKRCFSPVTLTQTFILALLQKPTATDTDIAAVAASLGVPVTPQAIDQRYTELLAQFFKNLFSQIVALKLRSSGSLCSLFDRFSEVMAIDSTVIALPAEMSEEFPGCGGVGREAALKLQTEIDLKTGSLNCVEIELGKSPDNASSRQQASFKKGSLRIADLGYFSIPVLARIVECAAHFISRVQFQTRIHINEQTQSVIDFLVNIRSSVGIFDGDILLGNEHKLKCRLMAWRVPASIAANRRKKLRQLQKKRGRTPTKNALANCDWNYLITDMPVEQLSLNEAIILYRSRWQIELLFKRWKSHCQIDLLDGRTMIHTRCRLWIRLCAAIIQQRWVATCCWSGTQPASFSKVSCYLKQCLNRVALVINSASRLAHLMRSISAEISKICRRTKRAKKPGWIELIQDPSKLDYVLTWC